VNLASLLPANVGARLAGWAINLAVGLVIVAAIAGFGAWSYWQWIGRPILLTAHKERDEAQKALADRIKADDELLRQFKDQATAEVAKWKDGYDALVQQIAVAAKAESDARAAAADAGKRLRDAEAAYRASHACGLPQASPAAPASDGTDSTAWELFDDADGQAGAMAAAADHWAGVAAACQAYVRTLTP
jgi:hypothetical protein